MTKAVLIIAPSVGLDLVAEEAAALANSLGGVLLQGQEASVRGIVNAISQYGGFEGFWIASHGGDSGVLLAGHNMLEPISLAALLSAAGAEWLVLNSCDSRTLVNAILLRANVDVVATEAAIDDQHAWEFGRLVALAMANGQSLRGAVRSVASGSDRHRFYERLGQMDRTNRQSPIVDEISSNRKIDDIYTALVGDPLKNRRGLIADIMQMRADIENLYKLTWGVIVFLVALALFVGAYTMSGIFGLSPESPASRMQIPHETAVDAEGEIGHGYVWPGDEHGEHGVDDGDTYGGKSWRVGVPGVAMALIPLDILGPDVAVEKQAGNEAQGQSEPEIGGIEFHGNAFRG